METFFANKGPSSQAMVFPVVMYRCESWTIKKAEHWRIDAFELRCWRLECPLDCREIQPVHPKESVLNIHWKNWCWSWNSNTLATWWEKLIHWKRPWCCERLKVGGEGDDRRWDGWMASLTQWTWVWINSGNWCSVVHGVTKCWTRLSDWTEPNHSLMKQTTGPYSEHV